MTKVIQSKTHHYTTGVTRKTIVEGYTQEEQLIRRAVKGFVRIHREALRELQKH